MWSLGVTFFEILVGRTPFERDVLSCERPSGEGGQRGEGQGGEGKEGKEGEGDREGREGGMERLEGREALEGYWERTVRVFLSSSSPLLISTFWMSGKVKKKADQNWVITDERRMDRHIPHTRLALHGTHA